MSKEEEEEGGDETIFRSRKPKTKRDPLQTKSDFKSQGRF